MHWTTKILIVIWMMGLSGLHAAEYKQGYSSSHALVIGIDKYRHWPHLEYAVRDAREMITLLKSKGFRTYELTDQKATRENILSKLEAIKRTVEANSRVVIYFAGHGQTEDLPRGRERGYILPVDADTYNWNDTMLAMNPLNRSIRQIKAKHIFLAFDACYSGLGLTRSIKRHPEQDSAYISKMMQSRSIQILTAGSRSEQAIETEGHGLFTEHLLAALSGTADINADGYITATEIYATVRPGVTQQSYSRQTPQFGYIEGNGDIIFFNRHSRPDNAEILINSRIGGIDVWAGSTKIGDRLAAGRHRLEVDAGRTILMVKKGQQTLYHKRVLLKANREFTIQLDGGAEISQNRQPFSMLTIAHPDIKNYSNSVAHDLDGDGREEIITASGNRLYAFRADGSIYWVKTFNFPILLNLIDKWNNQTAIGISAFKNKKLHLIILNRRGKIIWRNNIRTIRRGQVRSPVRGKISQLTDIDGDGLKEIIAIVAGATAMKPCGIIVYDRLGREIWRYATGSIPQNIVVWPSQGKSPDLIVGTFSPGGGNRQLQNQTGGRPACVISINNQGGTNWIIPLGGYYTGVRVLLSGIKEDGALSLYAHKYSSYNYREDEGGIYKISRSGHILQRFEAGNSILNVVAGRPGRGSGKLLYAVDSKSHLYKLDERLNLLQKKDLGLNSDSREIRLAGVHDYDGDGVDDILIYSFDRLLYTRNPLAEARPMRQRFTNNLKFEIISQDFDKLLKSVTYSEKWRKRGDFIVKEIDRPNEPYYAFMALNDKITIFNY